MAISFTGIITPQKYSENEKLVLVKEGSNSTVLDNKGNVVSTGVSDDPLAVNPISLIPIQPPIINPETHQPEKPKPVNPDPIIPPQNCELSTYGLALGETPISLSGPISEHFNFIFNPPMIIIQSDSLHRTEAASRLSDSNPLNNYVFVNIGVKLLDKCRVPDLDRRELIIPFTNRIIFASFFFPEYGEYLYIGEDMSLYRLEIQGVMPPSPPGENLGTGKVYTEIDSNDILETKSRLVTYGMWSNNVGNLLTFFTSSNQNTSSRLYHLEVRDKVDTNCASEIQFSIAYGDHRGSGSFDFGGLDYLTPSKAVYGQFASLCLDHPLNKFSIDGRSVNSFYAIKAKRSRFGDKMDEGNWELNLHHLSGSQFIAGGGNRNAHTGSNVKLGTAGSVLRLIDDSRVFTSSVYSGGDVFRVVSGTIEQGVHNPTNPHVYGLFYPNIGTIILDSTKLDSSASFATITGSEINASNPHQLLTAISGAALYTDLSGDYLGFAARKIKIKHSKTMFIRVFNQDYNFTNNPTYVSGSEGTIVSDFQAPNNPLVYITQIGFYNRKRELLAVGKISKPIKKEFNEEALFKVNLEY